MKNLTHLSLIALSAIIIFGCSKSQTSSSTTAGQVQVTMSNSTTPPTLVSLFNQLTHPVRTSPGNVAPSAFKVRLKAIYLIADQKDASKDTNFLGDNIGTPQFIWENQNCPSKKDEDCTDMDWFDLADTTENVNKNLNSQKVSITAGTYRYIKMGFLGEQQGSNNSYENTQWDYTSLETHPATFASVQTEWAAQFDPPLVVAENDSITVSLDYNLDNTVYPASQGIDEKIAGQGINQPGKADDCANEISVLRTSESKTCFFFPEVTVSAEKTASAGAAQ